MLRTRVKELRARFDWSQEDLGRKVGATRQTIGMMEKGDYSPSVVLALKIAAAFGMSVEEVFYLEDPNGNELKGRDHR